MLYAKAAALRVPELYGSSCSIAQVMNCRYLYGLPVEVWGLGLLVASIGLRFHPFTDWWVRYLLPFGTIFALYLQYLLFISVGSLCSWCVISVIGFAIASLLEISPLPAIERGTAILGATMPTICFCFLMALLVPAERVPTIKADLSTVPRDNLTGPGLREQPVVVIFGSPTCPKCQAILPTLLQRSQRGEFKLIFRFRNLTSSRNEITAASGLKEGIRSGNWLLVSKLCSTLKVDEKALLVTEFFGTDAVRLAERRLECQSDLSLARQAGIKLPPTILACSPLSPCEEVPAGAVRFANR